MKKVLLVAWHSDPEMDRILRLAKDAGIDIAEDEDFGQYDVVLAVEPPNENEIEVPEGTELVVIDHHGDCPAASAPPEKFLEASSLGQFISWLAKNGYRVVQSWTVAESRRNGSVGEFVLHQWLRKSPYWDDFDGKMVFPDEPAPSWCVGIREGDIVVFRIVPLDLVFAAAADHCLAAAYAGKCPGVDPGDLANWRVSVRAQHQGRDESEIWSDINRAKKLIAERRYRQAWRETEPVCDSRSMDFDGHLIAAEQAIRLVDMTACLQCGGVGSAKDLREYPEGACHFGPYGPIPELPEAAAQMGVAVLAGPIEEYDGRQKTILRKVVLLSATPEQVRQFMDGKIRPGLVDRYGSPERGFAGGYLRMRKEH